MTAKDREQMGAKNNIVGWTFCALGVLILALNILGVAGGPDPELYITYLILLLGIGSSSFITIAFRKLL